MKFNPKRRAETVKKVETEYGEILLDESSGAYLQLNESASRIYSVLSAGKSAEEAARDLVDHYGINSVQASADARQLEKALRESGLL